MNIMEDLRRRFEKCKDEYLSDMQHKNFEERALYLKEFDRNIDILGYDIAKKYYDQKIWESEQRYKKAELRFNPNHDPVNGKFTSGSGLTNGGKSVKLDSKGVPYKYPELRLPKKEYGKVVHEINTNFHSRFEGKKRGILNTSTAYYFFEIHEFNEYNIYDKVENNG